jgi:hypothetical protein
LRDDRRRALPPRPPRPFEHGLLAPYGALAVLRA